MSKLGDFRAAVAAKLATDLSLTFVDGMVEGPSEHGDLGCSWPVGKRENPENVAQEILEIRVRVFKQWQQQLAPEGPIDPGPLEDLVDAIQLSLDEIQVQTGSGAVWFSRVVELEINVERYGVEAQVLGVGWNLHSSL